jgi:micrococcal nuclease
MPGDLYPGRSRPTVKAVVVWIVLLTAVFACLGVEAERRPVSVTYVIDGDTMVVRLRGRKVRVRLLGVDTPELGRDGRPGEPFARKARGFAEAMIRQADRVDLEIAGDRVDEHGRLLGFLWLQLPGRAQPVNLSAELLRAGLAEAIWHFDYPGKRAFLSLEKAARRQRVGMWRRRRPQ